MIWIVAQTSLNISFSVIDLLHIFLEIIFLPRTFFNNLIIHLLIFDDRDLISLKTNLFIQAISY